VAAVKTTKTKMSEQEKSEWRELYEYVRSDILLYDDNQSLSKQMVLRLKGMANGKLMANNKTANLANYSYKIILLTFKLCKAKILSAFSTKSFENETHKFNYACAIVDSDINDVYMRVKNAEKSKVKIEKMNTDVVMHEGAGYQKKSEETAKCLNNLW